MSLHRADDPTFIDWKTRKRLAKLSKSQRNDAKMEIELRRMRSAHAPDMQELLMLFERTLRRSEAPRHFPKWSVAEEAARSPTVTSAAALSPLDMAITAYVHCACCLGCEPGAAA